MGVGGADGAPAAKEMMGMGSKERRDGELGSRQWDKDGNRVTEGWQYSRDLKPVANDKEVTGWAVGDPERGRRV